MAWTSQPFQFGPSADKIGEYYRTRGGSTALVGSSLARTTNHSRWAELSNDVTGIIPGVNLMMPQGGDYAEGLHDILSLETNYLNWVNISGHRCRIDPNVAFKFQNALVKSSALQAEGISKMN